MLVIWTEKYRPKRLDEMIGNHEAIEQIRAWALRWKRGEKQPPLLLVGPPGVGKTTAAYAVANEMGWEVIEMNASDQRTKSIVEHILGAAATSTTLFGGTRLVLIDEIDGLEGSEDRGGAQAILKILREARNPVILTANDPYAKPVGLVKGLCKVIEFKRVNYRELAAFLMRILKKERIDYDPNAVLELAKLENGDVRSALLDLQAIAGEEGKITMQSLRALGYRDREANIFNVLKIIFKSSKRLSPFALTATLDIDHDLFKAWIVENIPREYEDPEEIAIAFDYVSRADVFDGRIMRRQYWGFLRYSTDLLINGVAMAKKKVYRKFTGYKFPSWIKLLAQAKEKNQAKRELAKKIGKKLHCSTHVIFTEYWPFLKTIFEENVEMAAQLAAGLGLSAKEIAVLLETSENDKKVKEIHKKALAIRRREKA